MHPKKHYRYSQVMTSDTTKGFRNQKQRIKTARGRTNASVRWLQRQLNDPYVALAEKKGYRSRAAFKLAEINEKFQLLKPGMTVVDLGAAPGGWSQIAADLTKSSPNDPTVVAVDLLDISSLPGVAFLQGDFCEEAVENTVKDLLKGRRPDLVMSDMAPSTCGHRETDHLRILNLAEIALDFAVHTLAPGGAFLTKLFQGGGQHDFMKTVQQHFGTVRWVKPKSSRQDSSETFLLATGFKGA